MPAFEINPEDLPPEIQGILQGILRKTMDTGLGHDCTEDEVHPTPRQLALQPGDYVAVTQDKAEARASAGPDGVSAFMIGQVLDAEQHQGEYPDYDVRLMKSFILVEYFGPGETDPGNHGWFPRAKVVPTTKEKFNEMLRWCRDGLPDGGPPAWQIIDYNQHLDELAQANPDALSRALRCPECDSVGVLITITHTHYKRFAMGHRDPEKAANGYPWKGETLYACAPYGEGQDATETLECHSCGFKATLPSDIEMYG